MQTDLLISLPSIFFLSILVGLILYLVGCMIGAKGEKTEGKLAPYACGEDLPPKKFQVEIRRFFLYLTYFMILDVSAFILALSFTSRGIYPALFSVIIMFSLLMLVSIEGREKRRG